MRFGSKGGPFARSYCMYLCAISTNIGSVCDMFLLYEVGVGQFVINLNLVDRNY